MATATHLQVQALRKQRRHKPTPVQVEAMVAVLSEQSPRDRAALTAFYGDGESPQRLCQRLGIALTYFSSLRANVRREYVVRTGKLLLDPAVSAADASGYRFTSERLVNPDGERIQ